MCLIIGFIILCIFLYIIFNLEGIRELKQLRVKRIELHSRKIKTEKKLAVISDFHNNLSIGDKLKEMIMKEKPDVICIPGDLIKRYEKEFANNLLSAEMLRDLSRLAPVVYSYGNHEEKLRRGINIPDTNWKEITEILSKGNIYILDNEDIKISGISFVGYNPDMRYYRRFVNAKLPSFELEKTIGSRKKETFTVLLAHNPEYFDTYSEWGADLILSGHNHGGMVRLPFIGGVLSSRLHPFPKYDYGRYEKGSSTMLVSGGAGSHRPPIRVNNFPEILFVEIKAKP